MNEKVEYAAEWYQKAREDWDTVQTLIEAQGHLAVIAFHLHQTLEKLLKGFLIERGWELERTHDLVTLGAEAARRQADLARFQDSFARVTRYYLATRYPLPSGVVLSAQTLLGDVKLAEELLGAIGQV